MRVAHIVAWVAAVALHLTTPGSASCHPAARYCTVSDAGQSWTVLYQRHPAGREVAYPHGRVIRIRESVIGVRSVTFRLLWVPGIGWSFWTGPTA